MVAIEIVEIQVRVELEDPGLNTRGLLMMGGPEEIKHPLLNTGITDQFLVVEWH